MEQQQLDASKLTPSDRKELQQVMVNEAQKTNIQTNVHHLTNLCWAKCVPGKVNSSAVDKTEEACAQNCVNRWMDTNLSIIRSLESFRNGQQ